MWSILSTSMNVAAFVGPLTAAVVVTYTSWRTAMQLFGMFLVMLLIDSKFWFYVCLLLHIDHPIF